MLGSKTAWAQGGDHVASCIFCFSILMLTQPQVGSCAPLVEPYQSWGSLPAFWFVRPRVPCGLCGPWRTVSSSWVTSHMFGWVRLTWVDPCAWKGVVLNWLIGLWRLRSPTCHLQVTEQERTFQSLRIRRPKREGKRHAEGERLHPPHICCGLGSRWKWIICSPWCQAVLEIPWVNVPQLMFPWRWPVLWTAILMFPSMLPYLPRCRHDTSVLWNVLPGGSWDFNSLFNDFLRWLASNS